MRLARASPLLALALLASCARCGGPVPVRSAEELLPAQAAGAGGTIALGELARHTGDLLARASQLRGGEEVAELRKSVTSQLGFDPLTREGLLAAGLDPDRAAAFALAPGERAGIVIALPLTSADVFAQTVERLARDRAGYVERTEQVRAGVKVVVFARAAGADKLGYAVVRGYGVLARGDDPAADLAQAAVRTPAQSLAQDSRFAAARTALGAPDLFVWARAQSGLQTQLFSRALPGDAALGFSGSALGMVLRAQLSLAAPDAHEVQALLPGGGEALAALLPKDAPLQLRLGIAPALLSTALSRVPQLNDFLARLRALLAARHVDLDRDLFGALAPGAVASLALSPHADLARAVDANVLDLRRHTPFDLVQFTAYAKASDKARLLVALQAVADVLPQFGATATRGAAGDGIEWQVAYAGGEGARFGVRTVGGIALAWLLGGIDLDAALARKGALGAGGSTAAALQLDLGQLAAQVSALPEGTYGTGPQSYVARSLIAQVVEPLRPLLIRAELSSTPAGVSAQLSIDIAKAPTTAAETVVPR